MRVSASVDLVRQAGRAQKFRACLHGLFDLFDTQPGIRMVRFIDHQLLDAFPRVSPANSFINRVNSKQVQQTAGKVYFSCDAHLNGINSALCGKERGGHPGHAGADHHELTMD